MIGHIESYSNQELVKFLDSSTDPLIIELCKRIEGIDHNERVREAESDMQDALEAQEKAETDLEAAEERIDELEDLLRENKIEVPA